VDDLIVFFKELGIPCSELYRLKVEILMEKEEYGKASEVIVELKENLEAEKGRVEGEFYDSICQTATEMEDLVQGKLQGKVEKKTHSDGGFGCIVL
jgi:hypothetical protein